MSVTMDATRADAIASALDLARGFDVEIVTVASTVGLTRFAGSRIIQNTTRHDERAYVRVTLGLRSASTSTNALDRASLGAAVAHAKAAAQISPEDPDFPGLPTADEVRGVEALHRFDDATASSSPAARADAVREVLAAAGRGEVAGYVETSAHRFEIASSTGVACSDTYTRCAVQCLVDTGDATGWGEGYSHALAEVDLEAVAGRARAKAAAGGNRRSIEPGTYPVVLEGSAVATVLEYLAYAGFSAKQVIDGDSFLHTRTGQAVAAPSVTVADDAFHPLSMGLGFDLEGVPRTRVAVIDNGVATGPVTDRRTARLLGLPVTGHYSGSTEVGPYASNLVMASGDASLDELIAGVDDGLLVTRLHYVNLLDRPSTLLTGMTRDGTFRIRAGELAEPVYNLRFTESALDALAGVEAVGVAQHAFAESFGSTVAPAARIGAFHFSSTTTH